MEMTMELARKLFNAKKESAEEERKQEQKKRVPKVLNPDAIAITVFGFLDAEAESFLACGGTPRYSISEKQLFFLKWYDQQYPTTDIASLIRDAEDGTPVIYDWRNLQVLLTELVEDFKASKELQDQEEETEINLDSVPAHIRARLENKIK